MYGVSELEILYWGSHLMSFCSFLTALCQRGIISYGDTYDQVSNLESSGSLSTLSHRA